MASFFSNRKTDIIVYFARMNRKKFIQSVGLLAASTPVNNALQAANIGDIHDDLKEQSKTKFLNKNQVFHSDDEKKEPMDTLWAADEIRWKKIQKNYPKTPGIINLENGYFSHQSWSTLNKHLDFEFDINVETSRFMRTQQQTEIEKARVSFAQFLQIPTEQLAFTRNTTESLNTVIMGFPWQAGDEVIIGDQDYGSMVEAFEQVSARFGVIIKKAAVPQQWQIQLTQNSLQEYEESISAAYTGLISDKTKMVHVTDLINLTGQVVPTARIATHVKEINPNIMVVADAAHSLAHTLGPFNYSFSHLLSAGVDAVGGSLHKWLCNPIGVGFLIVKPNWIEKIWPLMGDTGIAKNNIRKFEHQGTRPIQSLQTISTAINQHETIGSESKLTRLQYLKLTWMGIKQGPVERALFGEVKLPAKWEKLHNQIIDLSTLTNNEGKNKIRIFGQPVIILNESAYGNSLMLQNTKAAVDKSGNESITSILKNSNLGIKMLPTLPQNLYYYQGAIATVSVEGYSPAQLAKKLLDDFGIYTVAIDHPRVKGVRVTPHLSSSFEDCFRLNQALAKLAK